MYSTISQKDSVDYSKKLNELRNATKDYSTLKSKTSSFSAIQGKKSSKSKIIMLLPVVGILFIGILVYALKRKKHPVTQTSKTSASPGARKKPEQNKNKRSTKKGKFKAISIAILCIGGIALGVWKIKKGKTTT